MGKRHTHTLIGISQKQKRSLILTIPRAAEKDNS